MQRLAELKSTNYCIIYSRSNSVFSYQWKYNHVLNAKSINHVKGANLNAKKGNMAF